MCACVARCGRVGAWVGDARGVWACARVRACVDVPIQVRTLGACVRGRARALSLSRSLARLLSLHVCVCVCVGNGHHVKLDQEYELPYPLEKADGETEDAWALKDGKGVIVLKLRFQVQRK